MGELSSLYPRAPKKAHGERLGNRLAVGRLPSANKKKRVSVADEEEEREENEGYYD